MTTHQLQQTMTNARRAIGTHGWQIGLSIVLLAAALVAYRATVPQPASPPSAASTVLGITLPYGTDAHDLPFGITDYLRADAPPVRAAAISSVLGIGLPAGATRAGLPSGLTDYLRPAHATPRTPAPAVNVVLGITLPYGTNAHDLPFGITDYLRSDR